MSRKLAKILLVDDDKVCMMALKRAIRKMGFLYPVEMAKDGIEALLKLNSRAEESDSLLPYIILLDINMPRMDGHEFLEELRNDPRLKKTPVFMLTSSSDSEDISRAYEKNVAGYIVKEAPYETFVRTFELIEKYTNLIILPS